MMVLPSWFIVCWAGLDKMIWVIEEIILRRKTKDRFITSSNASVRLLMGTSQQL